MAYYVGIGVNLVYFYSLDKFITVVFLLLELCVRIEYILMSPYIVLEVNTLTY